MKQQLLIKLAKEVTGFKTNQALATWLEVSISTVKKWQANESQGDGFRLMTDKTMNDILKNLRVFIIDEK